MFLPRNPAIDLPSPTRARAKPHRAAAARFKPLFATAGRYAVSTAGPVATSGAHFLASLVFVRNLPAAAFGLFSFVLVIVPFCMSMIASLLVLPVNASLDAAHRPDPKIVATCLKMNLVLCAATGAAVFTFLMLAHAGPAPALLLALFGAAFTGRWFARCFSYVQGEIKAAVASDLVYALLLIAGLGLLALTHHVALLPGAALLLLAALIALAPFGLSFLRAQRAAWWSGRLGDYRMIFRDLTRWTLLGVVLTELTANAHAYIVTLVSGSGAFALLAIGMLLMRPISLVQSALPDVERPAMTRAIAARDWRRLTRIRHDFLGALLVGWLGTVMLAAGLLVCYPGLLLKKTYDMHDVVPVALLSAMVMMVRNFRTPDAVLMQAAGAFKALAGIGTKSALISIGATLALLLAFGPVASLGGILAGELVILFYIRRLAAQWARNHG